MTLGWSAVLISSDRDVHADVVTAIGQRHRGDGQHPWLSAQPSSSPCLITIGLGTSLRAGPNLPAFPPDFPGSTQTEEQRQKTQIGNRFLGPCPRTSGCRRDAGRSGAPPRADGSDADPAPGRYWGLHGGGRGAIRGANWSRTPA